MRYLYIRQNASIMAMSIICPPEGPLDREYGSGSGTGKGVPPALKDIGLRHTLLYLVSSL